MICSLNTRPKELERPNNYYVFQYLHKEGFVFIPAPDTELGTLRAWKYNADLTFFCGIQEFIELLKRGELWATIRQQNAEVLERGGKDEGEHIAADYAI